MAGEATSAKVCVLVENYVRRRGYLGQHGFSVLVQAYEPSGRIRVLFDTGQDASVVLSNVSKLGLNLADLDAILISHGHYDHAGGLLGLLEHIGPRGTPVLMHPDALKPKFTARPRLVFIGVPGLSERAIKERGATLLLSRRPVRISSSVFSTGEVGRRTDFERVEGFLTLGPDGLEDDILLDDQGLVVKTEKGLVVLTGCAHSGLMNTLLAATELAGDERIIAVIGGFHLEEASDDVIKETVDRLSALKPGLVAACHCTGLKASCALMRAFGPKFKRLGSGDVLKL